MSLGIYTASSSDAQLSSGTFLNALKISLDSKTADVSETLLYLRSDSGAYTDISVSPVAVLTGKNIISSGGYNWKLRAGNTQPTPQEWISITAGNTIEFDDILDTNTYLPFWLYVSVPQGGTVASYKHVVLRIICSAIEA